MLRFTTNVIIAVGAAWAVLCVCFGRLQHVKCIYSRTQEVELTDVTTKHTNDYWRLVIPGAKRGLNLEGTGSYTISEYSLENAFGLRNPLRVSGTQLVQ